MGLGGSRFLLPVMDMGRSGSPRGILWLSQFFCPGLGPWVALARRLRGLARAHARTVTQKLDFVDLGLRSFRVDCVQAFLGSVFVVQNQIHQGSLPAERTAGSATQLGHSLKEGKCMVQRAACPDFVVPVADC